MYYGEDYDNRELTYLKSCGRSMDDTVWAIKIESMAEICGLVAQPQPKKPKQRKKHARKVRSK